MFNQILGRYSTCATSVSVSVANDQAIVEFKNGHKYLYSNVCPEAIYELLYGVTRSLGQFINTALLQPEVDCLMLYWFVSVTILLIHLSFHTKCFPLFNQSNQPAFNPWALILAIIKLSSSSNQVLNSSITTWTSKPFLTFSLAKSLHSVSLSTLTASVTMSFASFDSLLNIHLSTLLSF